MPVSFLFFAGIIVAFLVAVLCSAFYYLGRAREKNDDEKQKSNSLVQARMLRSRLDNDPDVAEQLRRTFKR